MTILGDHVVPSSDAYRANRQFMTEQLGLHDEQLAIANGGGGPKYIERHRQRDKLLARERVEALLDLESPFLELSPLAAWGTEFPVGAGAEHRRRVCEHDDSGVGRFGVVER